MGGSSEQAREPEVDLPVAQLHRIVELLAQRIADGEDAGLRLETGPNTKPQRRIGKQLRAALVLPPALVRKEEEVAILLEEEAVLDGSNGKGGCQDAGLVNAALGFYSSYAVELVGVELLVHHAPALPGDPDGAAPAKGNVPRQSSVEFVLHAVLVRGDRISERGDRTALFACRGLQVQGQPLARVEAVVKAFAFHAQAIGGELDVGQAGGVGDLLP